MRNYELTLLLKPGLEEALRQELSAKVASLLQEAGALIVSQDSKGKRFLASPIAKQREAELAVVKFTVDPQRIPDVEKGLKATEAILRFTLLSWLPRKAQERTVARPVTFAAAQENTEEPRVELGDIDKKLEEIFKDGLP